MRVGRCCVFVVCVGLLGNFSGVMIGVLGICVEIGWCVGGSSGRRLIVN